MAVYAIGDVQGCLDPLQRLLERIDFDPAGDTLWFTGDLVNRGPASLGVLRLVRALGARAVTVLGNHDLHVLAVAAGASELKVRDTFAEVLRAPDGEELLAWLRARPLLHHDADLGYTLVHAGLLPQWDLVVAQRLAREAEAALTADAARFFQHMYGDLPDRWRDDLSGAARLRVIVNAFTRLRFCDAEGCMDLRAKGPPGTQAANLLPWFRVPGRRSRGLRVVFGHWSALGRYRGEGVIGLDSGCVWGRTLTAVRLDADGAAFFEAPCPAAQLPHGE
jgi:bis(5'-nucleosyl)-tetraphosphatase (symmetrical)